MVEVIAYAVGGECFRVSANLGAWWYGLLYG